MGVKSKHLKEKFLNCAIVGEMAYYDLTKKYLYSDVWIG